MASVQCNSIVSLKEIPFRQRSNEDKFATKQSGPPRPNLNIKQISTKGGKSYNRGFSRSWYELKTWLAGCETANALFCYPWTLLHPDGSMADATAWTTTGVTDMHYLGRKRSRNMSHLRPIWTCLKFSVFGRVNIATQLDESYRLAVRHHNNEVSKNRHILARSQKQTL